MNKSIPEEVAFDIFPDEIFQKDFQKSVFGVYRDLMMAIAKIKNPKRSYNGLDWQTIYHISFLKDDNFELGFVDPISFLRGTIIVVPRDKVVLDRNELLVKNKNIFLMSGVEMVSFKRFPRAIRFIDIKRRDLLLRHIACDPMVLCEAEKRFPQSGLIVVEFVEYGKNFDNPPYIIKPTSDQFPRLLNFSKKIKKILKEEEKY